MKRIGIWVLVYLRASCPRHGVSGTVGGTTGPICGAITHMRRCLTLTTLGASA